MKEYFNGFSTQDLTDMKRNDDERKEKIEMRKEIARLTAESTKWESKFYDEAKKVDKAIEYINTHLDSNFKTEFDYITTNPQDLINILQGSDKE